MWKDPYDEYAQYEHNRTLSFALASMMYDPWTHAVLYHRVPGSGLELLGGGTPFWLIREFGAWTVEHSNISPDGILRIVVEPPAS